MHRPLIVAVLAVSLLPTLARAQQLEQPRTVNTTGESIVRLTPDQVIVGVGVESFDRDLQEVKGKNDTACKKLLAAIKALGVDDKDVQTDTLQVEIRYSDSSHPSACPRLITS